MNIKNYLRDFDKSNTFKEKLIEDILSFREDITEDDLYILDIEELLDRYYSTDSQKQKQEIDRILKI